MSTQPRRALLLCNAKARNGALDLDEVREILRAGGIDLVEYDDVDTEPSLKAFERAVEEVADSARKLIASMVTSAEPKSREVEAAKAKERSAARFGAKS